MLRDEFRPESDLDFLYTFARDARWGWEFERAYDEHDSTLVWLKVHPRFDALRDEARFRALLERMHL